MTATNGGMLIALPLDFSVLAALIDIEEYLDSTHRGTSCWLDA